MFYGNIMKSMILPDLIMLTAIMVFSEVSFLLVEMEITL